MADDSTDDKPRKTLIFLHGMESRYGKTKPSQVEAQAKAYADKRGMRFEAIPISGDNKKQQFYAAQRRVRQGDVGAVLGFSAGGYTAAKLHAPGVEKIIVGAPRAQGNQTFPGRHMDQVKGLTASAPRQQQTRFPQQPPPVSTGAQGAANRVAGLDSVSYLARTATPAGTMSRQGGATAAISRLDPEFSNRLASGIQALRANGYPNAGIASAFRTGSGSAGTGSRFDRAGQSLHSIGAAVDLAGIGGPGSRQAQNAHKILAQHGVYGVYGPNNRAEYNHFQLVPQKSVSALGGDPAKVRQFAGSHLPTDDQLHQLWGIADKRVAQAPSQPASKSSAQSAAPQQKPTMAQVIAQNSKNPEFAPYSSYVGMIPDQNLPVDQWKQKHGDLYNNPMVPQGVRSIFDKALAPQPAAKSAPTQQSFPPMPQPRPQASSQASAQQQPQFSYPPTSQQQLRAAQGPGYSPPQAQWPQANNIMMPPTPGAQPNNAQPITAGPQMAMPQQQAPQPAPPPGNTVMMPPTAGGQPNNAQPIMGGPQMNMAQPPMPPQMQPGLSGGSPFGGAGGLSMPSMAPSQMGMSTGSPVVAGGDMGGGMGLGGGPGFGMGGGFGGGDASGGMGGGRGGGSKVNMQAAMQMIPKPTQPNVDISQLPQMPQTQVNPAIKPGQGGDMSLVQSIMQFLQGGQA